MAKWVTMVRDRDPAGPAACRKERSFRAAVRRHVQHHPDWEIAMCRIAKDESGMHGDSHFVILGPKSVLARGRWDKWESEFNVYSLGMVSTDRTSEAA